MMPIAIETRGQCVACRAEFRAEVTARRGPRERPFTQRACCGTWQCVLALPAVLVHCRLESQHGSVLACARGCQYALNVLTNALTCCAARPCVSARGGTPGIIHHVSTLQICVSTWGLLIRTIGVKMGHVCSTSSGLCWPTCPPSSGPSLT